MEEENEIKTEKTKSNLVIIVLLIAFFFIGIGCGLLIFKSFGSNENKESNNNHENTETNDDINNSGKTIITEREVMDLYNKYHSLNSPVELSGNAVEKEIYSSEIFEISKLNGSLPVGYSYKIVNQALNELNSEPVSDNYEDAVYQKIEKAFNQFFGNTMSYNKSLFDCYQFSMTDDVVRFMNYCGDISSSKAYYTFVKYESDSNNVYVYEDVTIENASNEEQKTYTYKWTYKRQNDGKYYFVKAERVNN